MRGGAAAAALAVVLGAGCGAPPPQPPAVYANRVASALTGIEAACGESFQQRALPRLPGRRSSPLAAASERAAELRGVVARNPEWVYQGQTLSAVAALAAERLRECGLAPAARVLSTRSGGG